jgi:hypothetical protein
MLPLGHLKNTPLIQRFLKKKPPQPKQIKFIIPKDFSSSAQLTNHIEKIVQDPKSWVYIDTSFLMWLTKIGPASRQQCFQWLEDQFQGRVIVPVWAAHEYLRHHSVNTLSDDIGKRCKQMGKLARQGYFLVRPFLDSSTLLNPLKANDHQALARKAFQELEKVSKLADVMKKQLKINAEEVINFINDHVPNSTNIFSVFDGIDSWGAERYDSRIPPGFQDKSKKGVELEEDEDSSIWTTGTNKFGDLIFWKEILDDAVIHKAKNAIILTNDLKNDWQMGGRLAPTEGVLKTDRESWKPYPLPHPMLSYEASLTAKLEEVLLLDSIYLGLYLKRHDPDNKVDLIDVALVPKQPYTATTENPATPAGTPTPSQATAVSSATGTALQSSTASAVRVTAQPEVYRFNDLIKTPNLYIALKNGLRLSFGPPLEANLIAAFTQKIESSFAEQTSIADLFIEENLIGFTVELLIRLGRTIHDKSLINTLGNPEGPIDLLNILSELPPKTASCLYLGFLSSMYLEESGSSRIPPKSKVSTSIWDRQKDVLAREPIKVIREHLQKEPFLPLYLPNSDDTKINVVLDHIPESDGEFILGSVKIDGEEVFSPAQRQTDLNLLIINENSERISPNEIVKAACSIYCIPQESVNILVDFDSTYKITSTAGFRTPKDISKTNTED